MKLPKKKGATCDELRVTGMVNKTWGQGVTGSPEWTGLEGADKTHKDFRDCTLCQKPS